MPAALLLGVACSEAGTETPTDGATGGSVATGGTGSGGALGTGGSGSGGAASGGASATGGSGGTSGGGTNSGGTGSGGGSGDFFGDSRCEAGDFLLCDGFEDAVIDAGLWSVEKSDGNTVEIAADQAARGGQSVHIRAQNGRGLLRNTSIFPVANDDYFARMFLRVARFSTVPWAHWTVAEAAGTGSSHLIRVGGQYVTTTSVNRWGVGSDGGPTGDWTTHDNDPNGAPLEPATNAWVCLEWEHRGSEDVTRFFVDGEEHPSLATTATDHGGTDGQNYVLPSFTSVWFGWWQYQADDTAFDVWIDEVAIDDERIGCTD